MSDDSEQNMSKASAPALRGAFFVALGRYLFLLIVCAALGAFLLISVQKAVLFVKDAWRFTKNLQNRQRALTMYCNPYLFLKGRIVVW